MKNKRKYKIYRGYIHKNKWIKYKFDREVYEKKRKYNVYREICAKKK